MRGRQARVSAVAALVGALALLVVGAGAAPGSGAGGGASGGFEALSGSAAASFVLPSDVELVKRLELPAYGLTYERYQQVYGAARAKVYGGQLTLYRDGSGAVVTVIGAHYPGIVAKNSVSITAAQARQASEGDIGPAGERLVDLLIDPASGRYFYRVETRRLDSRWIHWIDAGNGAVVKKFNTLADISINAGEGVGVKGDVKSMAGLTTFHNASGHGATGSHYDLFSTGNRQKTYDVRNGQSFLYYVTDADDKWDTPGRTSPGHPALVDAQYYANVSDDFFQATFGLDWLSCYPGGMQSAAHYARSYNNAFWNGTYVIYGDGDGTSFREFSGGLDVVAHEHAHGVTECTSNLTYSGEPGALNEAFSDILGNSAEFFYGSEPADWLVAEDVYLTPDIAPGFRNMGDPEEDGDPDHYTERYTGTGDNGGVHTNSGIPNHAYYLLVNGGMNASCASPLTHNAAHCSDLADTQDNDLAVTRVGLAKAEQIFFLGFTALPQNATMCQARDATVAAAAEADKASTKDAWVAVGLTDKVCGGGGGNTAPTADAKTVSTGANTPKAITLTGSDAETCDLTFGIVSGPSQGSLGPIGDQACVSGNPKTDSAAVTYTPVAGYTGSDSFTYSVTDAGGLSSNATVSITVNAAGTMHIGDLDAASTTAGKNWKPTVTVTGHDGSEQPVAGATVTGSWSNGVTGSTSCTTGTGGTCSMSRTSKTATTATFTVTNVALSSLTYVSVANHDPERDSNGTSITLTR